MPRMKYKTRLSRLSAMLTAPERAAFLREIDSYPPYAKWNEERVVETVYAILSANRRFEKKAAMNKASDGRRRTLVGARLPVETVEEYRRTAAARGQSLYAWVSEALAQYAVVGLDKNHHIWYPLGALPLGFHIASKERPPALAGSGGASSFTASPWASCPRKNCNRSVIAFSLRKTYNKPMFL